MALGFVVPVLWKIDGSLGTGIRLATFFLASWGVSWLNWRFIEQPLDLLRRRPGPSKTA